MSQKSLGCPCALNLLEEPGVGLYLAGGRLGIFPQGRYEDDPEQQAMPGQAGLFYLGRKLKI